MRRDLLTYMVSPVWWCFVVAIVLVLLSGCAGVQQGPPVTLEAIAVPKVVEESKAAAAPAVQQPPPPPRLREGFRVWILRHVTANGDVYEGHYVDVSNKPPQKELQKPDYEIPKAPKQIVRPASKSPGVAGTSPAAGTITRPPTPLHPAPPSLVPQGATIPGYPLPQEGVYDAVQP